MKYAFFLLITFSLFFISCREKMENKINIQSFQNIQYTSIQSEKIEVLPPNSSYSGFSGVYGDSIYFFDNYLGYLYLINTDGEIIKRMMGTGKGPHETIINEPEKLTVNKKNNQLVMLGDTYDIYIFTNLMNRQYLFLQNIESDILTENTYKYNDFSYVSVSRVLGNDFYYNLSSDLKELNIKTPGFFDKFRILMKVDLNTGKCKVIGNYSEYYQKHPREIAQFYSTLFDFDKKENFHITFQVDSLIYIYNKNFKLIKAYGFEGKNMDKDYKQAESNEWKEFWEARDFNLENKGTYTWLEYVEEQDMTFRSYTKGSHSDKDGLQIYQDGVLIADLEVPKGLKVAGYIAPYFISQIICDEDNETMYFYKFKLE